jgi:hypothetical protein
MNIQEKVHKLASEKKINEENRGYKVKGEKRAEYEKQE